MRLKMRDMDFRPTFQPLHVFQSLLLLLILKNSLLLFDANATVFNSRHNIKHYVIVIDRSGSWMRPCANIMCNIWGSMMENIIYNIMIRILELSILKRALPN